MSMLFVLMAHAGPIDDALDLVADHLDPDGPDRLRPDTLRARLEAMAAARDCAPVFGGGGTYYDHAWSGTLAGLPIAGTYGDNRVQGLDEGDIPVPLHDGRIAGGDGSARYAGADIDIAFVRTSGGHGIWTMLGGCAEATYLVYGQSNASGTVYSDGYYWEDIGPGTDWPGSRAGIGVNDAGAWYTRESDRLSRQVGLEGHLLRDPGARVIKSAMRGTSLSEWLSPYDQGNRRSGIAERTLWGLTDLGECPDIAAWLQGEADASDRVGPPDDYAARWDVGIATRLSNRCPGVLHVFVELDLRPQDFTEASWRSINAQMRDLAVVRGDMVSLPTADIPRYDGIHYGYGTGYLGYQDGRGWGYETLGERLQSLRRVP